MIITRTPFRISFLGGGTDYPAWYRQHGGSVLATTIDKYCYLFCRRLPPFFDVRFRVVYSKIELCQSIDEIVHPAVREGLRYMGVQHGLEIHHDGDLPARSGMGSSSAFAVGLLNALYAIKGQMVSKRQLARESVHLEQEILRENVGSQDQVSTAYGGFNQIVFETNGEFSVRPVTAMPARLEELNAHLMLFYTGIKRTASNVAATFVNNFDAKKRQLRVMKDLVDEGVAILCGNRPLREFGELLHEAWLVKQGLSSVVSNPEVEEIYQTARESGALGGKLLGAGGGGFMLLFVPPEYQETVKERLANLIHVPFKFDHQGSQVVFFDPDPNYDSVEEYRTHQTIKSFHELQHS